MNQERKYYVNGEVQATAEHKLSVQVILENAGFTPATDFLLTRDEGNKDLTDYDEEVPVHDGERFTATFEGPTPASCL